MNPNDRQRLRTPQGTEGFFLEEAYRHRQLLRMTEDHYASWGYLPILTPVFDYFETYRPLLDDFQVERSYRFPDRNGELLMLRADITLFLAKQMGLFAAEAPLPRRVWYADSILRHQDEEDISSDEFFQSGAELIGLEGLEGDLEVLMILHDLLDAMDLPEWRLHIGSRAVLDSLLEGRVDSVQAGNLLEIRDIDGLEYLFKNAGLEHPEKRIEILHFLGTIEEFAKNADKLTAGMQAPVRQNIADVMTLASRLGETASMDRIRIDLSEHGGQPYYTGFTVGAYLEGANTAVASGGRYDDLLAAFGPRIPAAGFSLLMRKIEPLSGFATEAVDQTPITAAVGSNFAARYRDARIRREAGERVVMTGRKEGVT